MTYFFYKNNYSQCYLQLVFWVFWSNVYYYSFYALLFFIDVFLLIFWISLSDIFSLQEALLGCGFPEVFFVCLFVFCLFVLNNFTYLLLAMLGLCCYTGFSLVEGNGGSCLLAVLRLLIAVASLIEEYSLQGTRASVLQQAGSVGAVPWLQSTASVDVVCRRSCSAACEVFLGEGSNSHLLPWQADSLPLSFQYFGHLVWSNNSLEKNLLLGKTEGRRRRE